MFDWQQIAVYVIVALAALYLAWGYFGKKRGGCGSCETGCSTSAKTPVKSDLIQIEPRR